MKKITMLTLFTIYVNAQIQLPECTHERLLDPGFNISNQKSLISRIDKVPVRFFELSESEDLSTGVQIEDYWYVGYSYSERYLGQCPQDELFPTGDGGQYGYYSECMARYAVQEINYQLSQLPNTQDEIFEFHSYERIYDPENFDSIDGHATLLEYFGDNEFNASGFLNIIMTNSMFQLAGTTYLYQDANDDNGALLLVHSECAPGVVVHELGHVLGFPHIFEPSSVTTFNGEIININPQLEPNCYPNLMGSWIAGNCTSEYPNIIDMGDINSDGNLDIVSAYSIRVGYDGKFGWHEGNIDEGFTHHLIDFELDAYSLDLGDINGDSYLDVAGVASDIFNSNASLKWYRNNGAGNFEEFDLVSPGECTSASSITIIDFENDGDMDIVGSCNKSDGTSAVYLYLHDGENLSEAQQLLAPTGDVYDIDLGDIDNDGDLDILVTASEWVQSLYWFEIDYSDNNQLSYSTHLVDEHAKVSSEFVDFNEDGNLDIISFSEFGITLYQNNGTGLFVSTVLESGDEESFWNPRKLVVVDGDGDLDLDIVGVYLNGLAFFEQTDNLQFNLIPVYYTGDLEDIVSVFPYDMNEDGLVDFVVSEHDGFMNDNDNILYWLKNNGELSWNQEFPITEMLRLSFNTPLHGEVFSVILESWTEHHITTATMGDINEDDIVNVLDLVILVDMVLMGADAGSVSDMNSDGMIDVLDIVTLVDYILNS